MVFPGRFMDVITDALYFIVDNYLKEYSKEDI
jgi:hypothetical protein